MSNLKYKHTAYTSAQWASLNPVIVENEIVIESDTKRTKIGNGISTYNELEYADANSVGNSLGSIKPTDAAPTPARNGNYTFSIGGNKPAWLTAEAGITTVKAGDGVAVVYTAPSSYTYTHVDTGSSIEQARSQSTSKVPSSKLVDDELTLVQAKADANSFIHNATLITSPNWISGSIVTTTGTTYAIGANAAWRYVKLEIPSNANSINVRLKYSGVNAGLVFVNESDALVSAHKVLSSEDYNRYNFEIPEGATHVYYTYTTDAVSTVNFDVLAFYYDDAVVNAELIQFNTDLINSNKTEFDNRGIADDSISNKTLITSPTWISGSIVTTTGTTYAIGANAAWRYVKLEIPSNANSINVRLKYSGVNAGLVFVNESDALVSAHKVLSSEDYNRYNFEIPEGATHVYYTYTTDALSDINFDVLAFYYDVSKEVDDANALISINTSNIELLQVGSYQLLPYEFVANQRWDTITGIASYLAVFNGYHANIPVNTKYIIARVPYTSGTTGFLFTDSNGRWAGGYTHNDIETNGLYKKILVPKNAKNVYWGYLTDAQATADGVSLFTPPMYQLLEGNEVNGIDTVPIAKCISDPANEKSTHGGQSYIIDENNKMATVYTSNNDLFYEGPNGEDIKLSVYNQLFPERTEILQVAYPNQTLGVITLPDLASLVDPNIFNAGDGDLIIAFNAIANYSYYFRKYNIATGVLASEFGQLKIKVSGVYENMSSTNITLAIREFTGDNTIVAAGYTQFVSRQCSYNGVFYAYIGGYLSSATERYRGCLLKSTDCINWEVVYYRPNVGGAYSYSETDMLIIGDTAYLVQRFDDDSVMGKGSCMFTIDMTDFTATDDVRILDFSSPSTARPALFKDSDDNVYCGITSGDLVTPLGSMGRCLYSIFQVNTATPTLSFKEIVRLKNVGAIHYCSIINNNEEIIITYSTDRRRYAGKGGNTTHLTNNIDFIKLSWSDINKWSDDDNIKVF